MDDILEEFSARTPKSAVPSFLQPDESASWTSGGRMIGRCPRSGSWSGRHGSLRSGRKRRETSRAFLFPS